MNMQYEETSNKNHNKVEGKAYTIAYYRRADGVADADGQFDGYFPEGIDRSYFDKMDPLDIVEEIWYTPVDDLGELTIHRVLIRYRTIRCGIDELCPQCKGGRRFVDNTGDRYDCGECGGSGVKPRPDPLWTAAI
jgi:hypothetical protein